MAQLRQKPTETMRHVDLLRPKFVDGTVARGFRVVDHPVWRVALTGARGPRAREEHS